MRLPPILGIIWARRAVLLIPVVGCLLGATVTMLTAQPRYISSARVIIDYIKPDPETGVVVPSKMVDAYVQTQVEFIRDYHVAGLALEALGWLDSPDLQAAYAARDGADTRDFKAWASLGIMGNTSAAMVQDSNIIEIRYVAQSPELAQLVVGALRDAYIQGSLDVRRSNAAESADALSTRLTESTGRLERLEAAQTKAERETGLVLNEQKRDLDSARLSGMTRQQPLPTIDASEVPAGTAVQRNRLAQVEADVATAQLSLGPNNPNYQAMLRERDSLRASLAQSAGASSSAAAAYQANARAQQSAFEALKAKVLAQRQTALELKLLQDQIDRERTRKTTTAEALAQQRQMANAGSTGLRPVGEPSEPTLSVSSNIPLIIAAALAMGLAQGVLLALLVEFLARHVRTTSDLKAASGAPVLGVVPKPPKPKQARALTRIRLRTRKAKIQPPEAAAA